MTERELKPCPFCGGDGHVAYRGDHFVTCRECKAFGPDAESDETAIALWNRRTTPDREAIIEECAKVCDEITRHHYPPQKISGFCASAIRAQKTAPNGEKGGSHV
ncbi:TPA: Lar family restriction alleviation protein [Burkholderia vietnamiensis]|nr:Lar family restriction alleviation protein [Burkholderia vietnamiensis]